MRLLSICSLILLAVAFCGFLAHRSRGTPEFQDRTPPGHGDYYYVRVTQLDGAHAWSSPVWVGGEASRYQLRRRHFACRVETRLDPRAEMSLGAADTSVCATS